MTYRGHSVLQTLIRARFSPAHNTGQVNWFAECYFSIVERVNGDPVEFLDDSSFYKSLDTLKEKK